MDGLRDVNPLGRFAQPIVSWLSLEAASLCERLNQLFQKQGISLRFSDDAVPYRLQSDISTDKTIEQFL